MALELRMNGLATDALCAVSMAEQRIKGTLTGAVLGFLGAAALAYVFAPEAAAILGMRGKRR